MAPSSGEPSNASSLSSRSDISVWQWLAVASFAIAVFARLIQHDLVWVEEAYGLAAAAEILRGKSLYSELWFDKPPLYAWFYVLCGGRSGWPLRILGCVHIAATAAAMWWTGRRLWSSREGWLAAALSCLALTFWIPSAVMAAAPDLLMVIPHVLAVGLAAAHRPLLSGAVAGVSLLCNSRGVFVAGAACLWTRRQWMLLCGFAGVQLLTLLLLPVREYWLQVWQWGFVYSGATFVARPIREGVLRTAGWAWFHLTATIGAFSAITKERDWRLAAWILLSVVALSAGWRFFPRYYFHLMPVIALAGARGLLLLPRLWRAAVLALLLIPAGRFGPRYIQIAVHGTAGWSDAAMMEDSRAAGTLLKSQKAVSPTLLVWGYRPDVYVFSGMPAATRFLDSQPLTGVLADRHLTDASVLFPELAKSNRAELRQTRPEFIVDGLGLLNPQLAITAFSDLRQWLGGYTEVARTPMSIVYRLRPDGRAFAKER